MKNKMIQPLSEVLQLIEEVGGVYRKDTGEVIMKGLLMHSLPLVDKYRLTTLCTEISKHEATYNKLRDEGIVKYGEGGEKDGYKIENFIEDPEDAKKMIINPKYTTFQEELSLTLEEPVEFEYTPFDISILEKIESEINFPQFYKLIKV
jgi:hypothetical protein